MRTERTYISIFFYVYILHFLCVINFVNMLVEFLASHCVCIFIYCFKFKPISSSELLHDEQKDKEKENDLQKGKTSL